MGTFAGETLPFDEDEQTRLAKGRVGHLLRDRWRLDELLGLGGMAAVYAATHRNGKRVAIKMLHAELSHHAEARRCFIDEGYLANRVLHSGVVSILDDDVSEDGAAFLVMDLLEGETLDARMIRKALLDPLEILPIVDDLLDVLVAAHAKGIVHCDIKPTNIFITLNEHVKLLDFGIARLFDKARGEAESRPTMGTPAFMAPEHARGRSEQLDGRTDLWAVGATMFMALTGRHVHEAETNNEELLAAMTLPAPSLGSVAPNLPKPLVDLVDRALAFELDERWPDARAMQAALRDVHAILVDAQLGSAAPRDSMVSFEEAGPPIASHAPVTLTTNRALALSQGFENGSLAPPGMAKGRWRALAVGVGVLFVAVGAWRLNMRNETLRASAATVEPTPAPMAAPAPAPVPTAVPRDETLPHGDETSEAKEDRATDPSDALAGAPSHGRKPSRTTTKPSTRSSTTKTNGATVSVSPAPALSAKAAPAQQPATPAADAVDPLDRRR